MSYGSYNEPSPKRVTLWVVVTVLILAAISAGVWGIRVATAPVVGVGDAHITKYSAENWTKAQARFEGLYAEIVATDQKISVAKSALDASPNDRTAKDNYYGTQTVCLSFVADYNAEARSYLAEDFRAADLPEQISGFDKTTDCKE